MLLPNCFSGENFSILKTNSILLAAHLSKTALQAQVKSWKTPSVEEVYTDIEQNSMAYYLAWVVSLQIAFCAILHGYVIENSLGKSGYSATGKAE